MIDIAPTRPLAMQIHPPEIIFARFLQGVEQGGLRCEMRDVEFKWQVTGL